MKFTEEELDDLIATMKKNKQDMVSEKGGPVDIPNTILIFRDNDHVCTALSKDSDQTLDLAHRLAYGMAADTLVMHLDAWGSTETKNPMTDEEWGPGEIGFMAENYPEAREKGWVTETLMFLVYDRGGEYTVTHHPYQIVDGVVEWGETWTPGESGGRFHDVLYEVMTDKTILDDTQNRVGIDFDALPEDALVHRDIGMDLATLTFVQETHMAYAIALSAEPGSERAKRLDAYMKENKDKFEAEGAKLIQMGPNPKGEK